MKTKTADTPDAIKLRKQAEEKLSVQKKKGAVVSQPGKDLKHLVHELEVHQIELEIQNEELKQTRAELETALDQFTDLYDFAPVSYFTLSRDGVIQRTNLAGTTLLGVERFRLVQKRLAAFVPAESYVVFNTFLQNVFSTLDKETCEIALLNSSRQKIWVQLEGLRIEKSESCRIAAMDITKRKLAEAEQAKLAAIVASSEDAIMRKTLDGVITSWNAGAQRLYGYTEQEAVGQSVAMLVPKDHPDELPEILAKIRSGEPVEHFETVRVRKDGVKLDVSITVSPIFDEAGRVAAASSISRDVTQRKRAEEKIKYQATLLSNVNDAIVASAAGYRINSWNTAAESLYGWKAEEVLGQIGVDILRTEWASADADHMRRMIREKGYWRGEATQARKDGTRFPVEISTLVLHDEQGQISGYVSVNRDISERKQAEEKLRESEARFRAISQSANDAIISADETGVIVDWNQSAERMFGYTETEAHGQRLALILPDRYIGEHHSAIQRVQGGGEKHIIGRTVEREGRRRDNSEFPLEISVSEWQVDNKKYYSAIIRDITARKEVEKELAAIRALYQLLAENSWDSVSLINSEDEVEYVSPSYMRRLGYAENEMLKLDVQGILERLHPDDRNYVANEIKRGRELKLLSSRFEYRARTKSGEYIWLEDVLLREFDEHGQFIRTVVNTRDITERKQADDMIQQYASELEMRVLERTAELMRASHAKDEFLASMSHELRTPLNSILGFSETLLEGVRGPLNERQIEAVEYVNSSGQHLLGLINDILDLSKIEANKFDLRPETVVIENVCTSSLLFIRQITQKKMIEVEYIRQDGADTIFADPKRLKQILVNLLSNAAKFTPEKGKIKLEVRLDAANGAMLFSVSDTGIGISSEDLKKLFKPFMQLDSSLSRRYEGSGLGLALVKDLAELHGGSVRLESVEGQGSCFTVSLPWTAKLEEEPQPMNSAADHPENPVRSVPARILLAEDNEVSILVVRDYLEHFGYEVFVAHDGEQVLPLAEQCTPDLILMDIQMPNLNGVEATLRVRSHPKFDSVPIVALTALAMPGDRERLLKAGVDDYLSKPVNLQSLMKLIEKLLKPPS